MWPNFKDLVDDEKRLIDDSKRRKSKKKRKRTEIEDNDKIETVSSSKKQHFIEDQLVNEIKVESEDDGVGSDNSEIITPKKKKHKRKIHSEEILEDFNEIESLIEHINSEIGIKDESLEIENHSICDNNTLKNEELTDSLNENNDAPKEKKKKKKLIKTTTIKEEIEEIINDENDASFNNRKKKKAYLNVKVAKGNISSDEDNVTSTLVVDKNDNLLKYGHFEPDFQVPPLHEILNRAAKITIDQRKKISAKHLQIKSGKYSAKEDQQIKENWNHFFRKNKIQHLKPRNFFCLKLGRISRTGKRNFLYYLARNMPERSPYSVFQRFKILFADVKVGRFTEQEDEIIGNFLDTDPIEIAELAQQLHRQYSSVEKHLKVLKYSRNRRIKWRGKNATTFIRYLLKVTKISEHELDKLKNIIITTEQWNKLSDKLDNVPVRTLKFVWYEKLHPILFIPQDVIDLREVKVKLIKLMYDNNERDWKTVNWKLYLKEFDGFTTWKLFNLFKVMVRVHVPVEKQQNLRKCLKTLKRNSVDDFRQTYLKKFYYQNKNALDRIY